MKRAGFARRSPRPEGSSYNRCVTTLLIVEDDSTVRETLALNLRSEGYTVETAEDGEMALEKARLVNPDLVVLDVMLPKLDGLTLLRILRRESRVPVVS